MSLPVVDHVLRLQPWVSLSFSVSPSFHLNHFFSLPVSLQSTTTIVHTTFGPLLFKPVRRFSSCLGEGPPPFETPVVTGNRTFEVSVKLLGFYLPSSVLLESILTSSVLYRSSSSVFSWETPSEDNVRGRVSGCWSRTRNVSILFLCWKMFYVRYHVFGQNLQRGMYDIIR